jgi:phosphotransferase system HPr-like phosphotransfer protein
MAKADIIVEFRTPEGENVNASKYFDDSEKINVKKIVSDLENLSLIDLKMLQIEKDLCEKIKCYGLDEVSAIKAIELVVSNKQYRHQAFYREFAAWGNVLTAFAAIFSLVISIFSLRRVNAQRRI